MSDWTSGYVTEINYTSGYYPELSPLRTQFVFANLGLQFPDVVNACELAFGQGVSINIHAAAGNAQWWGNDFMPAQAASAAEMARAAGSNAQISDESFAEFCQRDDLPDFDYIALHGIFSWITADNQQIIVDFIRRKLRMGGVLYISYNTFPGWSTMMPVRHLLAQHADVMGAPGVGVLKRLDAALNFTEELFAKNPRIVAANPQLGERFKVLKGQERHYLAHEYFNRNWEPMFFADMARRLESAKLSYAGSGNVMDHVDALNLSADQQTLLKGIADPIFRETVRDFIVYQQFRRDYWVKGPRRLSLQAQVAGLMAHYLVLTTPAVDVKLKATGMLGEASLQEAIYKPLLELMADHKPRALAQIVEAMGKHNINLSSVVQAVLVLIGKGSMQVAHSPEQVNKVKGKTQKLNAYLLQKSRTSDDIRYLASPVLGGGVLISRISRLAILAMQEGRKQPAELADFVWLTLNAQGQKMIKDGKTVDSADENKTEIVKLMEAFVEKELPMLKAVQVI